MMGQPAAQASISLTRDDVKAWWEQREDVEEPLDDHTSRYNHDSTSASGELTTRASGFDMALESQ